MVLPAFEHPIIATPIAVLQMSMALKNILTELSLVFEFSGAKSASASLALLVLALELMLLAKLSALSMILALQELATIVFFFSLYEDAVTISLVK